MNMGGLEIDFLTLDKNSRTLVSIKKKKHWQGGTFDIKSYIF